MSADVGTGIVTRRAPAKINLGLAITDLRLDGYHELRSVFLRVGLCDRLTARPAGPGATADVLEVVGDADCPIADNLVLRAARLVRDSIEVDGADLPPLALTLAKQIPMGAGLAGGSSDAAAAIDVCAESWGIGISPESRLSLAARLGADVPFFAAGGPAALVEGIGERLEPLPGVRGGFGVVLVTPPIRMATREAFAAFDALDRAASTRAAAAVGDLAEALRAGLDGSQLATMAASLRDANDLWPAAAVLAPELRGLRSTLERGLERPILMTGSGSTLVALYPSVGEAAAAGAGLAADRVLPERSRSCAVGDAGTDTTWRFP